jgi:hypothetical protein
MVENRVNRHYYLHGLNLVHSQDLEVAVLVLVHASGVDKSEGFAGKLDVASFVIDLSACHTEGNLRSQISGPVVRVPLVGTSMD